MRAETVTEREPAPHAMVFHQIAPGDDTRGRWEMYCRCGAWQHGTKAEVERTAEMHRADRAEGA
jgi:hypothetical protein